MLPKSWQNIELSVYSGSPAAGSDRVEHSEGGAEVRNILAIYIFTKIYFYIRRISRILYVSHLSHVHSGFFTKYITLSIH